MPNYKLIVILFFLLGSIGFSQSLSGKKICLDPGHGFIPGQASNCNDAETKRFESYINHIVVPNLKRFLQGAGATVITTRADYDSVGPCITLTQRKAIANNANVDFFHSVHHNAFDGTSNYSLSLFKQLNNQNCPNGNPAWPNQADLMANIQQSRLFNALATTSGTYRGDLCFLGFNLGVLSTLNMPGTLSEASFFDNADEKLRLSNVDYLRTEAEALYHSFLQYYGKPMPSHGSLVGIVTNPATGKPVKNVVVSIDSLNLHYTIDNLGNGFYRFDSLSAGIYKVKLTSSLDTTIVSVSVSGGAINRRNLTHVLSEAVGDVKLKAVLSSSTSIMLQWEKPAGTPDSIDIYLSIDASTWDTVPYRTVSGSLTSATLSGLLSNQSYFVKLKARNNISESPNFSKVYGAYTSSSTRKALIVDGFNRTTGSFNGASHSFVGKYGKALESVSLRYETVSNSVVLQSAQLLNYRFVFWILGDESTLDSTLNTVEQSAITGYLKQGGKLFISGSEIGYDLDANGTTNDKNFYYQFLKAKYIADNPTPNTPIALPVGGGIFQHLGPISLGTEYPEDFPDVIDTLNGSVPVFLYNSSQKAGILFDGMFPSGIIAGKLIHLGFAAETIGDTLKFNSLLRTVVDFFDGLVEVNDNYNVSPKSYSLSVFPNPFNPATRLVVQVPVTDYYTISVHSILGEQILTVTQGTLEPGTHNFLLEMSNFPSGIYFVRLYSEKITILNKIMLLK